MRVIVRTHLAFAQVIEVLRDICLVVCRENNERTDGRHRNNPTPHRREVSVVLIYTFCRSGTPDNYNMRERKSRISDPRRLHQRMQPSADETARFIRAQVSRSPRSSTLSDGDSSSFSSSIRSSVVSARTCKKP